MGGDARVASGLRRDLSRWRQAAEADIDREKADAVKTRFLGPTPFWDSESNVKVVQRLLDVVLDQMDAMANGKPINDWVVVGPNPFTHVPEAVWVGNIDAIEGIIEVVRRFVWGLSQTLVPSAGWAPRYAPSPLSPYTPIPREYDRRFGWPIARDASPRSLPFARSALLAQPLKAKNLVQGRDVGQGQVRKQVSGPGLKPSTPTPNAVKRSGGSVQDSTTVDKSDRPVREFGGSGTPASDGIAVRTVGDADPAPNTSGSGSAVAGSKMVWDRSTVEDMLALEQAQKDLEDAERKAREGDKDSGTTKEEKEQKQPNPPEKGPPPKTSTPAPPPPNPKLPPLGRPNPDDEGGANESVHRPFHPGLGVGPTPRRNRVSAELRAILLAHGLDVAPIPDDQGGPPNPYARATDLDESPNSPNPPLDGPNPPAEMGPSAGRGEDPLLRDLRLRYLLAVEGTQSDEVVTNPRALGFKPNPEDPYGPHGPNARVRDNPTVGGGLRPRNGRLM